MSLRQLFILMTLGCLIGATAMAATPDYATLGVTNGQDLGTTVHRHANGGASKLVNTHRVPMSGTPEEIAARFVAENAQTLFDAPAASDKAGDVQVGNLTFKLVRVTSSMSGDHVWMQAYAGDIPVRGGYVVTHLTHDGQVLFVTNELGDVGFELAASAVSLDRASALAAAARIIGGDGLTRVEPKADLVVLREGNRGRLAWRTETATYNPYGDWEIMVDAANGAEISRRDLIICLKPEEKPASINPPTAPMTPDPMNLGGAKGAKAIGTGLAFIANPLNNHADRYGWRDGNAIIDTARDAVSLTNLSGSGLLAGPWVEVFNTDAPRANEPTLTYNYSALLANGHFQEVNVYYHINYWQEYMQSLGILNARDRVTNCYAHQGEDDNSDYSPSQDRIRYGDGGVDDSDDGEIVVHEYGHAIHNDIVPGFVYAGESGAISEGFGDYLGAALGNNPLVGEWDATAYNAGPPPFLRRTDTTKHYPEDIVNQVHSDGEIISAAWWDLRNLVGPTVGDRLVIEGMFYTGTSATFQDYADGIVAADQALYAGAHVGYIYQAFGGRGIGPTYLLNFTHAQQGDTEDLFGPYHLVTTITHTSPITAPDAVKLHYRYGNAGAFTEVVMNPTGGFDEWAGDLPGPGAIGTVEYYLSVVDASGIAASLPASAPAAVLSFAVGPDSQAPVITHNAITDKPLLVWPAVVNATITDNGAISSATVSYTLNGVSQPALAMASMGGNLFSATFPEAAAGLVAGDEFTYSITAVDGSSMANTTVNGPHTFQIIDALGVVLIIDDDVVAQADEKYDDSKGALPVHVRDEASKGAAANAMASVLTTAGWVVYQEPAATSDPATWPGYSFIISSSGANTSPVAGAPYRAALEAYVAAGGKLLLEGGEVAYDAISSPGYPTFKTNVVHGTTWNSDSAGPLVVRAGMATHPIMSLPFTVASPLAISYTGYGDEDAYVAAADAYVVMGTTNYPNSAGIAVYDNTPDPASAQIVNFAFNYAALTDQAEAAELLQNTALFLTTPELGGTASISGEVTVLGGSNGGVLITANPGGFTATTAFDGTYTISGLYANTYTVTATLAGYGSAPQMVTLAAGQHATDVNFGLAPITEFSYCASPSLAIPDNNPTGVSTQLMVTDGDILAGITCSVNVTHTWKGDLVLELTSPLGTTVRLHNRTGGSTDNIVAHFGVDTAVDGPGTLADFAGQFPIGMWTLHLVDAAGSDTGTLNSWCLNTKVTSYVVANEVPNVTVAVNGGRPQLSWNVAPGMADGFNVYRRTQAGIRTRLNDSLVMASDGRVEFVDQSADFAVGTALFYSVGVVRGGSEIAVGTEIEYRVGAGSLPTAFALYGNYPNPFNPLTTIKFDLPRDGHVALRIYDLSGRAVRTLADDNLVRATHTYQWDGTDDAGHRLASGVYYYRVDTDTQSATGKMMLVK
ncbi:MAG: proprotein convertase P-domain-containing protein [bacterium]|nr:proprotein convertase P-domain-containing protein [bacterium]